MIGGGLARRYARALLDIGREERQVRRILAEVDRFAALLSEVPSMREALEAAHINSRDKLSVLDACVLGEGFLPTTANFLRLLVEKGRMKALRQILSELRRLVEELEGIERVEVLVPVALSGTQKDFLKGVLEQQTGKRIELEEKVDPAVLGGMVVKVGSTIYDGSVKTQLSQIRENLRKG